MGPKKLKARTAEQQRGTDTVEALRKAGITLLRKRAFHRISVAELARQAGVGVGTFYHFFPSKEALLLDLRNQLFQQTVNELAAGFSQPVTDGTTLRDALERLITGWITMSLKRRGLERAVTAAAFADDPFAQALRAQELGVERLVADLLRNALPALRPLEPDAAARTLVITINAVVQRAMQEPDLARHPGPVVRETARMITRYLLPPRARL
jgi:AcrR family transcriptional regulator